MVSSSKTAMSPLEVAEAVRLRLAAELHGDRTALGRLASSIADLRSAAGRGHDETMRALALAFQIERFYTAVEAVTTRILRTLDGDVPSGPEWHRDLLRAASVAIEGLRPAVLPAEALPFLRDLLGFRHFARHGYDVVPDPGRIDALADTAAAAYAMLHPSLVAFEESLRGGHELP
jgi:hypothetical protein